jgi:hypothetical protein
MAAQDMTDALKKPHPDVPFATIGDEKISALATLAEFFYKKVQKDSSSINPTGTSQGCRKQTTGSTCPTNIRIATQMPISNQITNTSHPNSTCKSHWASNLATTFEGGYTSNRECSTSEVANRGAPGFSAKYVTYFFG